jgi:hypothetical protein
MLREYERKYTLEGMKDETPLSETVRVVREENERPNDIPSQILDRFTCPATRECCVAAVKLSISFFNERNPSLVLGMRLSKVKTFTSLAGVLVIKFLVVVV